MTWIDVIPYTHQHIEVGQMKAVVVYATVIVPLVLVVVTAFWNGHSGQFKRQLAVQRSVYLLELGLACSLITTLFSGIAGAGWWLPFSRMSGLDILQTYLIALTVYQLFIYVWAKQRTSAEVDGYEAYQNWLELYLIQASNEPARQVLDTKLTEMEGAMLPPQVRTMIAEVRATKPDRFEYVAKLQLEQCRHAIATAELEWNQSLLLRLLK